MDFFWPLVVVRYMHLGSLLILFGASLFALYDGRAPGDPRTYRWLALLALVSGGVWLLVSLADMLDGIAGLAALANWHAFFVETGFGGVWAVRLAGLLALLVCTLRSTRSRGAIAALCGLSGALSIGTAWLGHAAAGQGVEWLANLASYGCHVLGAGAWLGGLVPLSRSLRRHADIARQRATLARFSHVGMAAVALIAASGILNAAFRSLSFDSLLTTSYGRLLAVKVLLFLALIGLAAINRWVFLPRLSAYPEATEALSSLRRSVVLELTLGAAIVAVAAVLGSTAPGE
jgi:putative copper resistance protein D